MERQAASALTRSYNPNNEKLGSKELLRKITSIVEFVRLSPSGRALEVVHRMLWCRPYTTITTTVVNYACISSMPTYTKYLHCRMFSINDDGIERVGFSGISAFVAALRQCAQIVWMKSRDIYDLGPFCTMENKGNAVNGRLIGGLFMHLYCNGVEVRFSIFWASVSWRGMNDTFVLTSKLTSSAILDHLCFELGVVK